MTSDRPNVVTIPNLLTVVTDDEPTYSRVLRGAWTGARALAAMAELASWPMPRMVIDAQAMSRADAFSGLVIRRCIDVHLQRDSGHAVVLREPRHPLAHAILHDLLGHLTRPARWAGEKPPPPTSGAVLLPAHRILDREDVELLPYAARVSAGPRRLPIAEARLMYTAVKHLAHNDFQHRAESAGLIAVCHEPQANDLQVVCFSCSAPAESIADPSGFAETLSAACRNHFGGLGWLVYAGNRRGLDGTLRIRAGRVRLFARSGRVRPDILEDSIPAFVAAYEVHLAS